MPKLKREEIYKLLRGGTTYEETAEIAGVSVGTVNAAAKELGIVRPRGHKQLAKGRTHSNGVPKLSGKYERCNGCGFKIIPPCLNCITENSAKHKRAIKLAAALAPRHLSTN